MEYSRIHKNAVKAWMIGRVIFWVVFFAVYYPVVFRLLLPKFGEVEAVRYGLNLLSIFFVCLCLIHTLLMPFVQHKEWKYAILEDRIELLNGVLIRSKIIIPISRIQYIEIERGPIYQLFRLASLNINTASDTHEIPALTLKEADELSQKLKTMIEIGDEIEQ